MAHTTPVVIVPLKAFKITRGALPHYATPSLAGGHNLRGFCPKCGSRLTGAENPESGIIGLTALNLDDPSCFKPKMDIFVRDAQAWNLTEPDLPKHQHYKPRQQNAHQDKARTYSRTLKSSRADFQEAGERFSIQSR
ncbi:MAG TPA: GFA family protein [Candidatus Dormibacteraeota bacterium]|nr:GFA family protein [Candidatus Dormibacteraeota bacterium]